MMISGLACFVLCSLLIGSLGFAPPARISSRMFKNSLMMCEAEVAEEVELPVTPLSQMEIRVGKIIEIDVHPEAENLFIEKVDVGEEEGPRTIVSGLVKFCKKEDLLNKNIVVLCNLKPRPLKGVVSAGMLLCASNEDHTVVEPLIVPG